KGGDPFVFGRGGEECEALRAERISYEIIPGIISALAAPAFAGVPVTHRKVARSVTIVTGHTVKGSDDFENWRHLALADTLVILMGMRNLDKIADKLIKYGRDSSTPVAVVEKATFEAQQVATGTLSDIAEKAKGLSSPGTIIIGEVAAKSESLAWFQQYKLDEGAGYEYQQPIAQLSYWIWIKSSIGLLLNDKMKWRRGRVVRYRIANPGTAVQIRPSPLIKAPAFNNFNQNEQNYGDVPNIPASTG